MTRDSPGVATTSQERSRGERGHRVLKRIILSWAGALVSVLALGSVAWADHRPDHQDVTVTIEEAARGPIGSVNVSGTIVCEGNYFMQVVVRQRLTTGGFIYGERQESGRCWAGEPTPWETTVFADFPFGRGAIAVEALAYAEVYDPETDTWISGSDRDVKEFRLRRR